MYSYNLLVMCIRATAAEPGFTYKWPIIIQFLFLIDNAGHTLQGTDFNARFTDFNTTQISATRFKHSIPYISGMKTKEFCMILSPFTGESLGRGSV